METLTLTEKRRNLIKLAYQKGGITHEDALQIFQHKSTVSEAFKHLTEHNLLEQKEAPPSSRKQKIWFITDIGETVVKSEITDNASSVNK